MALQLGSRTKAPHSLCRPSFLHPCFSSRINEFSLTVSGGSTSRPQVGLDRQTHIGWGCSRRDASPISGHPSLPRCSIAARSLFWVVCYSHTHSFFMLPRQCIHLSIGKVLILGSFFPTIIMAFIHKAFLGLRS